MPTEPDEVVWVGESISMTLTELGACSGFVEAELSELVACGVLRSLDPVLPDGLFPSSFVGPLRAAARMRSDLDLDDQTMPVAIALLLRIEELEIEMRQLRARLPSVIRSA